MLSNRAIFLPRLSFREILLVLVGFVFFNLFGAPWHLFPVWGAQAALKYLTVVLCFIYWLLTRNKVQQSGIKFLLIILLFWFFLITSFSLSYEQDSTKIVRFVDRVILLAIAAILLSPFNDKDIDAIFIGVLIGGAGMFLNVVIFGEVTHNDRVNIAGSFTQTISVGRSMGAGMVAAYALWLFTQKKTLKFICAGLFLCLLWGTVVAGSRGPMLAALLSIYFMTILHFWTKKKISSLIFLSFMIAVIYAVFAIYNLDEAYRALNFFSTEGAVARNTQNRFDLYSLAINAFLERPYVGIGVNGFVGYSGGYPYPHNIFLEILAEGGLIAFLPFLAMNVYIIYLICRSARSSSMIMLTGLVVYFLMNSSVSFSFQNNEGYWLACAVVSCYAYRRTKARSRTAVAYHGANCETDMSTT